MRRFPHLGSRGRRWKPSRRFHGWLAGWLQDRRRARAVVSIPPLQVGLLQFYQPYVGATALRSWVEAENPPANLLAGLVSPVQSAAAGPYVSGNFVWYQVHPYREVAGVRTYPGLSLDQSLSISLATAAVSWGAWSATPTWATGCVVVRWLNWGTYTYRDLSLAAMTAGWTDDGTGWSAPNTLPGGFSNPPTVANVLWNRLSYAKPTAMPTVLSPLGGAAFDSTFGDRLTRNWSEDLRRSVDATMAYWVCPQSEAGGVMSSLRGVYELSFPGNYWCAPPDFTLGDDDEVMISDHVDGDWYLMVHRTDPLEDLYKMDLVRLRDSAQFSASRELPYTALTGASHYLNEGLLATLVFGSSWHWGVQGYGYYDRMALWSRALTDDEVLELFNSGLGWQPVG